MGRVLFVDNELSKDELAHRVRVVAEAMGIKLSELTGQIEIWSMRNNPRSLDELQTDFDAIELGTFRLVILDAEGVVEQFEFFRKLLSQQGRAFINRSYILDNDFTLTHSIPAAYNDAGWRFGDICMLAGYCQPKQGD